MSHEDICVLREQSCPKGTVVLKKHLCLLPYNVIPTQLQYIGGA